MNPRMKTGMWSGITSWAHLESMWSHLCLPPCPGHKPEFSSPLSISGYLTVQLTLPTAEQEAGAAPQALQAIGQQHRLSVKGAWRLVLTCPGFWVIALADEARQWRLLDTPDCGLALHLIGNSLGW
jgi:hypothetical protein